MWGEILGKWNPLRTSEDIVSTFRENLKQFVRERADLANLSKILPKRVNFVGIQNRHVVGCEAYHQPIVRTGYEYVIPYRVGRMFAYMAKKDGTVVSVNDTGIIIEYSDGKREGVTLGRIYGSASGLTMPHTVRTPLRTGDVFKKFDAIAYNTNFFEPDVLDPKRIIWKSSMLVNTAMFESPDTLEDSSSISLELSQRLRTKKTDVKNIVVNFDQEIHRLVTEGTSVEADTALCLIEDALSASTNMLDGDTIDTLRELDSQAPRAKIGGVIERVEVYYNGEFEDMSDTLQSIVKASDKRMKARSLATSSGATNGLVREDFRIGNDPLLLDTACIRIYLTSDVNTGIGDKGVFANQLKTVFGNVFDEVSSEMGEKIDAIFGQKSEADRIVTNPSVIGSTSTLSYVASGRIVNAYYS